MLRRSLFTTLMFESECFSNDSIGDWKGIVSYPAKMVCALHDALKGGSGACFSHVWCDQVCIVEPCVFIKAARVLFRTLHVC